MPTVLSLFSGVGTFDYGFQQAGWETIGFCEFDPKAREVLAARFPNTPIHDDITTMNGRQFGPADVVMGGFPCQDLSVAGKRAGMAKESGTRSSLFYEAIRVIKEMRDETEGKYPAFVVLENVPGLLSSNGGRDFAAVVWEFLNCGARDVGWRVLDAQFFGVPQRRRRIFLVADFGGERARQVLFESEGMCRNPQPRRKAGKRFAADVDSGVAGGSIASTLTTEEGQRSPRGDGADNLIPVIARCLTTRNQRQDAETENLLPVLAFDSKVGASLGVTVSENVSPTLLSGSVENGGRGRGRVAIAFDYKASVQRDPMCGQVSPTLEAQDKTAINTPDLKVRRLTPTECERLQGMPDSWTNVNGMADSHRYRFMGNGGAAPVLKWLAERMKEAL